jgi:hypothetical protein
MVYSWMLVHFGHLKATLDQSIYLIPSLLVEKIYNASILMGGKKWGKFLEGTINFIHETWCLAITCFDIHMVWNTKILMSNVINYGWTNTMQVMVIRYKWCFSSKNVNQNVGVYYLTLLSWNVGMSWKIDNFTFKQTSIYSSIPHQVWMKIIFGTFGVGELAKSNIIER